MSRPPAAGTARRLVSALLALTVAPLLSSCVDSRTDPPPPPVTVTAEELFGTWHGWEGSTLTLEPGAKAKTTKLDGQEFAFDDGWRMTGTGTWSVQEPGTYHGGNTVGNGSVVRLKAAPLAGTAPSTDGAVTTPPVGTPDAAVSRDPVDAASRTAPPPDHATWALGVTEEKEGELRLFFLTSDPDVRDTYYLTKDGAGA
ncbi:hypothetical protein OG233_21860 [Streptomyces sp. NBC_01218]|uniref:hypothetical protein n=1 Tax=Streptomyces sp. NBC_01218 TaxID=2903780 RepID=UPI002E13FA09|nr:hypothetical protein OG233_21860 [Streptomyces sp. NBC_01218]